MIDTVVLKVGNFEVVDCSKFRPNPEGFLKNPWKYTRGNKLYKSSNFYGDLTEDNQIVHTCLYMNDYMPKPVLYVTIHSIPKLLFGNNLQEVKQSDFDLVISKIKEILLNDCGIKVSEEDLEKAEVQEVHYSINFHLPEYITAKGVMDIIAKSKISGLYLEKDLYLQTGGVKFRTIDRRQYKEKRRKPPIEISFYDKHQEIKDRQPDIILPNSANILRYEVKLYKLSKIKRFPIREIFSKSENRQFRNVFNEHRSNDILKFFLEELKKHQSRCIPVNCPLSDKESSIEKIKQNKKQLKIQKRQMIDTLLQLLLAFKNENFKMKTFEILIFNYFFNDKKSMKFIADNNLNIKGTDKILPVKPVYQYTIQNLIEMVNMRRNANVSNN